MSFFKDLASSIPFVGPLFDKVTGVPTPDKSKMGTGSVEGENYKQFQDAAFAGTTPWERLGASTGGFPAQSMAAGNARDMQEAEFRQQRALTEMNNRAQIIAASSPMGAMAREDNLASYSTGGLLGALGRKGYKGGAEEVDPKIDNYGAQADAARAAAERDRKETELSPWNTISRYLPGFGLIGAGAFGFNQWLKNRGPVPRKLWTPSSTSHGKTSYRPGSGSLDVD